MPRATYRSVRSLPLEGRTERALEILYGDEYTSGELQIGELHEHLRSPENRDRFLGLWNYGRASLRRLDRMLTFALTEEV